MQLLSLQIEGSQHLNKNINFGLFQLNRVLGQSYDKKMAVIGLLKQYSVDRDIESLVQSFSELLKTEQERSLIPSLR